MRQTVAILVSLAVGFALGYLAANIGTREDTNTDSISSREDKAPSPGRARAGTSTEGDGCVEGADDSIAADTRLSAEPATPNEAESSANEENDEVEEPRPSDEDNEAGRVTPTPPSNAPDSTGHAAPVDEDPRGSSEGFAESEQVQAIRNGFRDLRPALRDCYLLLLDLEPDSADQLIFELEVQHTDPVSATGRVNLIAISSETLEIEDISCFAEAVDELVLPAPVSDGTYRVDYPVVLSSNE